MASDPTEFIGRKHPSTRYNPVGKFDRRLKSLNRPVPTQETMLPPDSPTDKFISSERTRQE